MFVGYRRVNGAKQRLCRVVRGAQTTMKQLPLYLAYHHAT